MFIPRAQPHAQSLFLFPIVFGINFFFLHTWICCVVKHALLVEDHWCLLLGLQVYQGTVVAAGDFNPEEDAAVLRKAMKGLGKVMRMCMHLSCFIVFFDWVLCVCVCVCVCVRERRKIELTAWGKKVPLSLDGIRPVPLGYAPTMLPITPRGQALVASVETNFLDTHPPAPSWNNHALRNTPTPIRGTLCVCVCVCVCVCLQLSLSFFHQSM